MALVRPVPKLGGHMSLRKAIDGKCRDCIYDPDAPGSWRQQTHSCNDTSCPLHAVQPKAAKPLTREALERYHNHIPENVEVADER